jgi:chorismate mutase
MAKSRETAIGAAINRHREGIQAIDRQILELLGNRMRLAEKIGILKKGAGLPITDKQREDKLREAYIAYARKHGLPSEFVESLLEVILKESKRIQNQ